MKSKPVIIYDNKCEFCIGTKNVFNKIDKKQKIKWIGINNFNNKKLKINKKSLLKEIHLISNGKVYKGYYAFKQISKNNPFLFPFYILSLIPGIDFIGTKIYGFISKHRYKI